MTTNYAGDPNTYPTNIALPDDGEPCAAAFLSPPWQQLASRSAHLNASRAALANLAALTALLVPTNGLVRHVKGHGLFTFDTAATAGLPAGDATAGRWVPSSGGTTSRIVPAHDVAAVSAIADQSVEQEVARAGVHSFVAPAALARGFKFYDASLKVLQGAEDPGQWGYLFNLDRYLRHGASLLTVAPQLIGGAFGDPATWALGPAVGVFRVPLLPAAKNSLPDALLSTGSGYVQDDAVDSAAFALSHAFTWTADQNNVIDLAAYSYRLYFWGCSSLGGDVLHLFGFKVTSTL